MTLSNQDAMYLQMVGFTAREIKDLHEAIDPSGNPQPPIDLNSDGWKQVVEARQDWLANLQKVARKETGGKIFTRRKRDAIIDSFYDKNTGMTPFDWLKREYQKARLNGAPLDYVEAQRERGNRNTRAMRNAVKRRR